MSKYGKYTGHQTEAIFNMLGGEAQIDRMLRGEMKVVFEVIKMILIINRSKPFDPSAFIGSGWRIWRGPADGKGLKGDEQQDVRSLGLFVVDFTKARFESGLAEGQQVITGEQHLVRLKEKDKILADANIGAALYNEPGQVTLEWLYQTHGVTWFELPGTELRRSNRDRYFLYLYRADGRWHWCYRYLGSDHCVDNPALVFES